MLKTINLTNFKCIDNEPISLENFNVLIGANSSGKSNFVDGLSFIRDIMQYSIAIAVGQRFGWENVLTRDKKKLDKISAQLYYDFQGKSEEVRISRKVYKALDLKYELEVGCIGRRFQIISESLISRFKRNDEIFTESFTREKQKISILSSLLLAKKTFHIPRTIGEEPFLKATFANIGSQVLSDIIDNWRLYYLDVDSARTPCVYGGEDVLLSSGNNLAAILDKLKTGKYRGVRNRIMELMSILVPGFQSWKTAEGFDGSLSFLISEKGISKGILPQMASDGTVRLLCILIALLYQPSPASLICIDEPERYLHPQVFEPLVEIMREVSKETQLIVTTHSTELVKYLQPTEVLMVDKVNNVTHIMRAKDVSMIDKFLEEFTLDELWLAGYLKGGKVL